MYLRLTRVTFAVKSNFIFTYPLKWPLTTLLNCIHDLYDFVVPIGKPKPPVTTIPIWKNLWTNHCHITDEILLFLVYRFMFVCKDFFYLPHCKMIFLFWWFLKSVEFLAVAYSAWFWFECIMGMLLCMRLMLIYKYI